VEFLTVDELPELLRVSRNQVVLMARRGNIPAYHIDGRLRFDAGKESRSPGSDFGDSTIFATSTGERDSFVRKALKAKRFYKRGVLMNTEFRYKGPRREADFRYAGRELAFLVLVIVMAGAILFFAVFLTQRGLLEALFGLVMSSQRALKGL